MEYRCSKNQTRSAYPSHETVASSCWFKRWLRMWQGSAYSQTIDTVKMPRAEPVCWGFFLAGVGGGRQSWFLAEKFGGTLVIFYWILLLIFRKVSAIDIGRYPIRRLFYTCHQFKKSFSPMCPCSQAPCMWHYFGCHNTFLITKITHVNYRTSWEHKTYVNN